MSSGDGTLLSRSSIRRSVAEAAAAVTATLEHLHQLDAHTYPDDSRSLRFILCIYYDPNMCIAYLYSLTHTPSLIVSFATTTTTEESNGGERTPNGDLNDQGVELTNVSFAHMSIQALNEMMMGRPANFYENEEVEDDDEDGGEDVHGQEVQLSPTSAARGSAMWMSAAAGAAVTKAGSSNRKTMIIIAAGTAAFLITFGTGLGGIINTNKAVAYQANLVDDCITTAPTTKSGKGSTSPTGSRRRMDSLRGVYGNSELGPKKAYLMELRTGSAKYSGGGGEEDIVERNLVSTHNTLSTFILALLFLFIVHF